MKTLNYAESSSILAGLRILQDLIENDELKDYRKLPHFDDVEPLSLVEIDELCEEINSNEISVGAAPLKPVLSVNSETSTSESEAFSSDEFQVLALHLGLDLEDESQRDSVEFLDLKYGIYRFKYRQRKYVVGHSNLCLPTSDIISFKGQLWSVSTKYMVRLIHVRTPVAVSEGWDDIVGQILEYTGNAHVGFQVVMKNGERRDLMHYAHSYVNA